MPLSPELSSACWLAIAKVAEKQAVRDVLTDGAEYPLKASIEARVCGKLLRAEIAGDLLVGHQTEKDSSSGPPMEHLLALLLARLPAAGREKLLRELPEQFAAAGQRLPDVAEELAGLAKALLAQLRAKVRQTVRGPVSVRYTLRP